MVLDSLTCFHCPTQEKCQIENSSLGLKLCRLRGRVMWTGSDCFSNPLQRLQTLFLVLQWCARMSLAFYKGSLVHGSLAKSVSRGSRPSVAGAGSHATAESPARSEVCMPPPNTQAGGTPPGSSMVLDPRSPRGTVVGGEVIHYCWGCRHGGDINPPPSLDLPSSLRSFQQ